MFVLVFVWDMNMNYFNNLFAGLLTFLLLTELESDLPFPCDIERNVILNRFQILAFRSWLV